MTGPSQDRSYTTPVRRISTILPNSSTDLVPILNGPPSLWVLETVWILTDPDLTFTRLCHGQRHDGLPWIPGPYWKIHASHGYRKEAILLHVTATDFESGCMRPSRSSKCRQHGNFNPSWPSNGPLIEPKSDTRPSVLLEKSPCTRIPFDLFVRNLLHYVSLFSLRDSSIRFETWLSFIEGQELAWIPPFFLVFTRQFHALSLSRGVVTVCLMQAIILVMEVRQGVCPRMSETAKCVLWLRVWDYSVICNSWFANDILLMLSSFRTQFCFTIPLKDVIGPLHDLISKIARPNLGWSRFSCAWTIRIISRYLTVDLMPTNLESTAVICLVL